MNRPDNNRFFCGDTFLPWPKVTFEIILSPLEIIAVSEPYIAFKMFSGSSNDDSIRLSIIAKIEGVCLAYLICM